jgi:trans-aconitate methyltransferase
MAQKATAGLEGMQFRVGDARELQEEGCFDVISLIDMLHYLEPEEQDTLIRRLIPMLKPGGMLVIRDPEPGNGLASFWTRATEQLFVWLGRHKGQQVRVRGGRVLAGVLAKSLERVQVESCSGPGFSNVLVYGFAGGYASGSGEAPSSSRAITSR